MHRNSRLITLRKAAEDQLSCFWWLEARKETEVPVGFFPPQRDRLPGQTGRSPMTAGKRGCYTVSHWKRRAEHLEG
jgi:hypothetical protein